MLIQAEVSNIQIMIIIMKRRVQGEPVHLEINRLLNKIILGEDIIRVRAVREEMTETTNMKKHTKEI